MADGRTVLKYPTLKNTEYYQDLRDEADRYTRLGTHENLVVYKGFNEHGLLLEYCERGSLEDTLGETAHLTDEQKTRIGKEIVRGLIHLHCHHFIHCDMHCRNAFLTAELVAKIGNIQGPLYRADGSVEMETTAQ